MARNSDSPLNDMPRNAQGGMVVPPGRSLSDMPKAAPQPPPSGAAKKPNARLTFRQLLTENGSKEYLVGLLRELGMKKSKGPWREYLDFYGANHSGDMDSMTPEIKAKCEKIVKDLNNKYLEDEMG